LFPLTDEDYIQGVYTPHLWLAQYLSTTYGGFFTYPEIGSRSQDDKKFKKKMQKEVRLKMQKKGGKGERIQG